MSTMTTLEKVHERVCNLARFHEDRLIPVDEISFNSLEQVCISGETTDYVLSLNSLSRTGWAFHQLSEKVPAEVQQFNMDHWIKSEKNEKLFFRFDGDEVRAVFTPRYVPTDNRKILDRLFELGYKPETKVQCSLDDEFMLVSIPDDEKTFAINRDKMTPGISISNSEVGLASLSIAVFVLRLVCTNGMISKTDVSASYRHVSSKILEEFPEVLTHISGELGKQKDQFKLSLQSKVENPELTIQSFNRQFELGKAEQEAVEWALPQEYGFTMFSVVNTIHQGKPI